MKLLWFALSVGLVAAGPLAAAQPHRHQHRHAEKRAPGTKTEYILNGTPVPYGDVQKGLAEGTLVIVGGRIEPASSPAEATSTPSSTLSSSSMSISSATSTTGSVAVETPTPTSKSESGSGEQLEYKAPETKSYTPSSSSGSFSGGEGVDRDFPDGEIDCSHFPSEYGAIALEHLKLGGWTGLQDVTFSDDGASITTIHTMKSGPCADGMMCSYACPPGYEKGQWPKEQGSTGQSVGGIQCKGGKLHLPGGGNSPKLCVKGAGGVKVHNTVGESIAICRTDYPGESCTSWVLYCPLDAWVRNESSDSTGFHSRHRVDGHSNHAELGLIGALRPHLPHQRKDLSSARCQDVGTILRQQKGSLDRRRMQMG